MTALAMFDLGSNLIIFALICFFIVGATVGLLMLSVESKKKQDEVDKLVKERERLAKKLLNRR